MEQVLSLVGAALVLIAFAALQSGRTSTELGGYQALNLIGALCLASSAVLANNWGFLLLNTVWAMIAAVALLRSAST
jgi:hypothetical protein